MMENKKYLIIAAIVLLVIIGAVILGFRSCEPRTKIIQDEKEEYAAFINANIEFTCELLKDSTLKVDEKIAENRLNEIYAKWRLPVEDDTRMIEILKKYENNFEVISIVRTNTEPCKKGDAPIFYPL